MNPNQPSESWCGLERPHSHANKSSVLWLAKLHAAAGTRWLSANPPRLEEALASFQVALNACHRMRQDPQGMSADVQLLPEIIQIQHLTAR